MAIETRPQQRPNFATPSPFLDAISRLRAPTAGALAALALTALLTACATPAARPASFSVHHAPPPHSVIFASPAMPADQIARGQVLLTDLGYRPGPANGLVGPETEEAIRAFQRREGLSLDGRMSGALLAQLEVADRSLSVRRAQVRLLALGYDPGPIDGSVGPRTRAAISVYEQDRGLPVRGEVTEELLQHLRAEQPAPLPRSRLATAQSAAEATAGGASQPERGAASEAAAGLASVAPAAGDTRGGADAVPAESAAVGRAASVPAEGGAASASDEQGAPAPIRSAEPLSGELLRAPAPTVSLAALPNDAGRSGRPLAPGDRIRLAVGTEGADVIEREIGADGRLSLPGGLMVAAAGLTLPELKRAIMVKLVESYLESLSVEVSRAGGAEEEPVSE